MRRPRLPLVTRREFDRRIGEVDATARRAGDRAEALSAALVAAFTTAGLEPPAALSARPVLSLVRGGRP